MHAELNQLIPSFVKRARRNDYLEAIGELGQGYSSAPQVKHCGSGGDAVRLIDYDASAEETIIASIIYPYSDQPLPALRHAIERMPHEARRQILADHYNARRHRRDKPSRAFENVFYTFDIVGNLGLYRDLHRHRIVTQERQSFTTALGYDTPPEIEQAGFKAVFDECMSRAAGLYQALKREFPLEAQYVVPFAYKIRWYMKMNLREAVHICELRTMPQGHPDYRFIAQEIWRKIEEVHPSLAPVGKFVDRGRYRLGRLQSEMRSEFKKAALQKADS
jgi:hypothetical protein